MTQNIPIPDTGSVREDLYQILQQLFIVLTATTTATAVTELIAEAQINSHFPEASREGFIQCYRAAIGTILERGIVRGELRSNLNLELVIDAIYGSVWYRLLLKHPPLDDTFAEELVSFLIAGISA
ncbi:TetR-like C-terminal domain-containing protein [Scytonema sp. UIC 10036]|uniref:TetR/AcrR family transcriptional regulator C-terminal ligand-binding domain-containing protein n=1 Tax=Scytonema sp. UIC 10036 TaxID=2304196 RepID=UPI0012DA1FE0